MNVHLLIDAIVRQTTVLIAQLATTAGVRAPLAHVANQVFVDLATELKSQGLGHKVIADMFGLALRTYHARVQRLSESVTDRGRSLWEAVLEFVQDKNTVKRAEVLRRFRRDDDATVRGVLRDLVDTGMIFQSGRGDATVYRAAEPDEMLAADDADPVAAAANVVWIAVHRYGPVSRDELVELTRLDGGPLDTAVQSLVDDSRVEIVGEGEGVRYASTDYFIPYDAPHGWEAAVFDHFQTVVTSVCTKLAQGQTRALPADTTGGSTWAFDIWPGHPLEDEVLGLLREVRERATDLRERVDAERANRPDGVSDRRVLFYAGQSVLDDPGDPA